MFYFIMFKIKKIEVETKHSLIAFLLEDDAKELSLYPEDRIKIISNITKKSIICELQIIDFKKKRGVYKDICLKRGEIGIFENGFYKLETPENKLVEITPAPKPKSLEFVKKKFNGQKLNQEEFNLITRDIVENKYSEIETTYFVISCSAHKLSDKEVEYLTNSMVNVGQTLKFAKNKKDIVVDKHCIGGIPNNRTTMLIVPIVAAAGLKIPKTSSRSITSPAGTADTMEVLANVNLTLTKMHDIVDQLNGCIAWGGSLDLSPTDDIIINVEHTLEIDSEGQMIASILSKKKSAGSTHVLLDIPIGKTAKVKNLKEGIRLKKRFEKIGKAVGLHIIAIITDGSGPIGNGIGPQYEANDVLAILNLDSNHSKPLKEKALNMAGLIFEMSKFTKKGNGYNLAKYLLESKIAKAKFDEIVNFQGKKKPLQKAKYSFEFSAIKNGKVFSIHNKLISKLAFILGAPEDKVAGIVLNKKIGDRVLLGENIFTLYSNSELKLKFAKTFIKEHQNIYILK